MLDEPGIGLFSKHCASFTVMSYWCEFYNSFLTNTFVFSMPNLLTIIVRAIFFITKNNVFTHNQSFSLCWHPLFKTPLLAKCLELGSCIQKGQVNGD